MELSLKTLIDNNDTVLKREEYKHLSQLLMNLSMSQSDNYYTPTPTLGEIMQEYNNIKEETKRRQYLGYCILFYWFLYFSVIKEDGHAAIPYTVELFKNIETVHTIQINNDGNKVGYIYYNHYPYDNIVSIDDQRYPGHTFRIDTLLSLNYNMYKIYISKILGLTISAPDTVSNPNLPSDWYGTTGTTGTLPGATGSDGGGKRSVPKRTNQKFSYKNKEYVIYEGSRAGKYIRINKKFISIRSL